jgi:hypothetical protein
MTDLVERHKPREGRKSTTRQGRTTGVPVTTPARREREDSPRGAEQVDQILVDQRGE